MIEEQFVSFDTAKLLKDTDYLLTQFNLHPQFNPYLVAFDKLFYGLFHVVCLFVVSYRLLSVI